MAPKSKSIILIPIALVLCASVLLANPIEVIDIDASADCGPLNHEVNVDPNDSSIQCLRIYFENFAIASSGPQEIQRNCHMKAKLRIPANTQFRASEAIAEGAFNMAGLAYGGLTLSYELLFAGPIGHWFEGFRPDSQGDFTFSAKIGSEDFTRCYGYETEIDLSSDLHAFIDQRNAGSSLVSLDETGKRLSWNWQIKSCEADLYENPFVSYYTAPNGRTYRAILRIAGQKGTYDSEAGFTGQLFNIRRQENGLVAEGEWRAQGARGTFRFRMTDPKSGNFTGTWRDTQGQNGRWWGEYQ